MHASIEKSFLEEIECHELFGEHETAKNLRGKYESKKSVQKKKDALIKKNQVFEGTLIAAGWDRTDNVNQWSLYTPQEEDILLEHHSGIRKFKPYLNKKVRICGDITSSNKDGMKVFVRKINQLKDGFAKPLFDVVDDFDHFMSQQFASK